MAASSGSRRRARSAVAEFASALLDAYCALASKAPWRADGTCADEAIADEFCGDADEYTGLLAADAPQLCTAVAGDPPQGPAAGARWCAHRLARCSARAPDAPRAAVGGGPSAEARRAAIRGARASSATRSNARAQRAAAFAIGDAAAPRLGRQGRRRRARRCSRTRTRGTRAAPSSSSASCCCPRPSAASSAAAAHAARRRHARPSSPGRGGARDPAADGAHGDEHVRGAAHGLIKYATCRTRSCRTSTRSPRASPAQPVARRGGRASARRGRAAPPVRALALVSRVLPDAARGVECVRAILAPRSPSSPIRRASSTARSPADRAPRARHHRAAPRARRPPTARAPTPRAPTPSARSPRRTTCATSSICSSRPAGGSSPSPRRPAARRRLWGQRRRRRRRRRRGRAQRAGARPPTRMSRAASLAATRAAGARVARGARESSGNRFVSRAARRCRRAAHGACTPCGRRPSARSCSRRAAPTTASCDIARHGPYAGVLAPSDDELRAKTACNMSSSAAASAARWPRRETGPRRACRRGCRRQRRRGVERRHRRGRGAARARAAARSRRPAAMNELRSVAYQTLRLRSSTEPPCRREPPARLPRAVRGARAPRVRRAPPRRGLLRHVVEGVLRCRRRSTTCASRRCRRRCSSRHAPARASGRPAPRRRPPRPAAAAPQPRPSISSRSRPLRPARVRDRAARGRARRTRRRPAHGRQTLRLTGVYVDMLQRTALRGELVLIPPAGTTARTGRRAVYAADKAKLAHADALGAFLLLSPRRVATRRQARARAPRRVGRHAAPRAARCACAPRSSSAVSAARTPRATRGAAERVVRRRRRPAAASATPVSQPIPTRAPRRSARSRAPR